MEEETFGLHQTLDCYKCDEKAIDDLENVSRFLNELVSSIGMRKMLEPIVMYAPPVTEKDGGGVSGFVMINESHISIHTFPNRRFITMDVYSCKKFDTEKVKEIVTKFFGAAVFEENLISRGKKFRKLATLVSQRQ